VSPAKVRCRAERRAPAPLSGPPGTSRGPMRRQPPSNASLDVPQQPGGEPGGDRPQQNPVSNVSSSLRPLAIPADSPASTQPDPGKIELRQQHRTDMQPCLACSLLSRTVSPAAPLTRGSERLRQLLLETAQTLRCTRPRSRLHGLVIVFVALPPSPALWGDLACGGRAWPFSGLDVGFAAACDH